MHVFGYLAGMFGLIGFLPQTVQAIRTRHTKDLSLPTFLMLTLSAVLWTIYGFAVHDPAIWITNVIIFICTSIISVMKFYEG